MSATQIDAATALRAMQAMNQKHVERADRSFEDLGTLKIFNISPLPHVKSLGGLGSFTIQGCPADCIYSAPLEIWKLTPEGYNVDMNKMKEDLVNGYAIAEAIVGYGKFMHPSSNMRNRGIFTCGSHLKIQVKGHPPEEILASELKLHQGRAEQTYGRGAMTIINEREATPAAVKAFRKSYNAETWATCLTSADYYAGLRSDKEVAEAILSANLPTEQEIDTANALLMKYCASMVEEANEYFRNNDLKEIQGIHRWCAQRTGQLDLPWVKTSIIMTPCDVCGNPLQPNVLICRGCSTVVKGKEEEYKKRMKAVTPA